MLRKFNFVNISLIIILAIIVCATLIFKQSSKAEAPRHTNHMDYFAKHTSQSQFNLLGERNSSSKSPYLYHMPQHDIAYIKSPTNISWSPQGQWTLKSEHAIYHHLTHLTQFIGHVVITQTKANTQPPTIIHTDHATYDGNKHIATTDAFVTIDQGANHQQGTGAIVKFKQKTIRLLSNTRGHYVNQ